MYFGHWSVFRAYFDEDHAEIFDFGFSRWLSTFFCSRFFRVLFSFSFFWGFFGFFSHGWGNEDEDDSDKKGGAFALRVKVRDEW